MNNAVSRLPRFNAFALMHLRTLALAYFVFLLPLVSSALTSGDYTYTVTDGKATITAFNASYSRPLSIPSTLGGYPVTHIGSFAFRGCTALTSVTIPDSVTSIGDSAFEGCTALTSVTIPTSVTYIYSAAFRDCSSLTSVSIGNSVTYIGSSVFMRCTSLTSVTIPGNVTSIGVYAFRDCSSLTSVSIGNSVKTIGDRAFSKCSSLTAINVSIYNPNYASFKGVLFDKTLTTLIQYPGGYSDSYTIPNNVTSIVNYAFYDCTSLVSVTLGNIVKSIGVSAFENCTSLTSVLFTGNKPSVGNYAFNSTLASIYYFPNTDGWGATFAGRPTKLFPLSYESVNQQITVTDLDTSFSGHIPIPDILDDCPVTSIGSAAFRDCTSVTSVTIPNSVTSISDTAFYGATNLHSVNIPDSVTTIGVAAFAGCTALHTAVLGSSLTSIEDWAFYGCTSLTKVYGRGNAPAHGASVFGETPATIYYRPGHTGWSETYADCPTVFLPFDYTTERFNVTINAYVGTDANVEIPQSIEGEPVTAIGDSAFEDCTFLESVTIPDSVQVIGEAAFCNCPLLSGLILPNDLREIGDWAFAGCDSLSALILPHQVDSIGDYAFAFCTYLNSVLIAGDTQTIFSHAFDFTPATIYYLPGAAGWDTPVNGLSPVCWNPSVSSSTPPRFTSGEFVFTLTGNANLPVTVEATTNLTSGVWIPVTNATLNASGTLDFTDPDSSAHPARFYRVTFPQ